MAVEDGVELFVEDSDALVADEEFAGSVEDECDSVDEASVDEDED